jgi:putative DNA primase/helicase
MNIAPRTAPQTPAAGLASALAGHRTGRGWMARCPAHDDRSPSLSIADGAEGRILLTCFAGCAWAAIRGALQARSLWPIRQQPACPARSNGGPRRPQLFEAGSDSLAAVKQIWRSAIAVPGTFVETYLQSRSITAPAPPTLRYASLWHRESGRSLPCMVAAVQGTNGHLTGLHRTWLRPDGRGKADTEPAKKMLGTCRGGTVRLAPVGPHLAICEGIETGLSIREACPDLPVWCALSAGKLDRLTMPPQVEEVVLVADGDPVGLAAAHRAAQRYGASGRRIRLVELPSGMDANDMLRHRSVAAA